MAPTRTSTSKQTIGAVFLKEFVRHLIVNSKPEPKVDRQIIERVKMKLGMKSDIPLIKMPKMEIVQKAAPSVASSIRRPIQKPFLPRRPLAGMPQKRPMLPMQRPQPKQLSPPRHITAPEKDNQPEKEPLNLGKLRSVFLDSSVTGVECQGPSKNILINRSGRIQASQITLSPQEIKDILQEFSQKTKIPLISGIFKALYNNFLITAIISETAGNRFIIEKHFGQPSLPKKEDVK
jgi:hypothetical protein